MEENNKTSFTPEPEAEAANEWSAPAFENAKAEEPAFEQSLDAEPAYAEPFEPETPAYAAPAEPKKSGFNWPKGLRVMSVIMCILSLGYFLFNAYSYAAQSILYAVFYTGFGLFYAGGVLFGLNVLAGIGENSKKQADMMEELLTLKKEELGK